MCHGSTVIERRCRPITAKIARNPNIYHYSLTEKREEERWLVVCNKYVFCVFRFFFLELSLFPHNSKMNANDSSKKRVMDSSLSSSSLNHPSHSHLPANLLVHAFSFLSLPELSHVIAINREWNRAALQAWNNKTELHLTGAMLEKGFDLLLIKNRCTHLQKLVMKQFNGHNRALGQQVAASLWHTPSLTQLEVSDAGG